MINQAALPFFIRSWDGWALERASTGASAAPVLLKRRVGALGQKALHCAWNISGAKHARYIFSSRHGEFGRTLSILDSYLETASVSPADFSLSVHHALIGLLSIAQKNHQGHTALASGNESFCLAMLEAYGFLQENPDEPVLIVHCDEPLIGAYKEFNDELEQPVVFVLLLDAREGVELFLTRDAGAPQNYTTLSCHAVEFIKFLDDERQETMVSRGDTAAWHWSKNG